MSQISGLRSETETYFNDLLKMGAAADTVQKLKGKFDEMWVVLTESSELGLSDSQEYGFVQEQIVPRRDSAAKILRQLENANEKSMTASEEDFSATRRAASERLLLILGAGLVLGIVVMRFSLRYSENLEKQTAAQLEEVSRAKKELERLSARLMEIQEEERTRLSRELHDEIVQNLAVLKIEITQAQALAGERIPRIAENLARARDLAERTVKTVRNISLLLRPSLLDDLGLGPALQWQTEDFSRRTGVRCDFQGLGLQDNLPDAVKTCVFRVTQEALHNCQKHAHATSVRVHVVQEPTQLSVEIEDDGVGHDMQFGQISPDDMHFGVLGMRERAAGLGGNLLIDAAKGRGVKITLLLPLAPSNAEKLAKPAEVHI